MDTSVIKQVLHLVEIGRIHHTVREGGNESYQINRNVVKHLLKIGLISNVKESCCKTGFKLTTMGEEYLHGSH